MANGAVHALRNGALVDWITDGFDRMQKLSTGIVPARPFFLRGTTKASNGRGVEDYLSWLDEAIEWLAEKNRTKEIEDEVFRPLSICLDPFGVHFIDSFFGARVYYLGEDGGWQVEPLQQPVGSLSMPVPECNPMWIKYREFVQVFLEKDVPAVQLGTPTLSSPLNIAVNLYGQEFLIALLEDEEAARKDLQTISDFIRSLHRWFRENVPISQLQGIVPAGRAQPGGCGQICGCTSQLVSAEQYKLLVAPHDECILSEYPRGGMIHLCGSHLQHLPVWRNMRSLRAVQLNDRAAEDFESYFNGLRPDQVIYVNPCPGMTIERIIEISGGARTIICADRVTLL